MKQTTTTAAIAAELHEAVYAKAVALTKRHDPPRQLRALHHLRIATEEAVRATVQLAREEGATWTEVGRHLKVSAQAAQQRYGR